LVRVFVRVGVTVEVGVFVEQLAATTFTVPVMFG
jgi:hypothetical protein